MPEDFDDRTDELLPLGFAPGSAVAENDPENLTVDDLKASLFESTATEPRIVSIKVTERNDRVPVVIDHVRAVWSVNESVKTPAGKVVYHDTPEWYAEGQVMRSDLRVRMYIIAVRSSHIDNMTVQFISDEPAPDGIIRVVCID
ncbi:hypothetical protein [Streptomyces ossamyceticus]|uniref:hypothetical protein n=1 Tax=Streptomyces ossamyceticus TaxID=249581 RepID=UPI0006E3AD7C|nr:hypothetical protein [Streptomyces ossamyceticus]